MRLIICGGAGYIGSHMCKLLAENGHQLLIIDDLSTGHSESVRGLPLRRTTIGDTNLGEIFRLFRPEAVFHFAGKSIVDESVADPGSYYLVNVAETIHLLEEVRKTPGCAFIYSSTAAAYGSPHGAKVSEGQAIAPLSPYGRTKVFIESLLRDYWDAYQLPSVIFRYFNAAGADPSGLIGESHTPETHLIPRAFESLLGRGGNIKIYGNDYDTVDGSCVRDYVHVNDLCQAHVLGLELLKKRPESYSFNLGNGQGFTVFQVLSAIQEIVGRKLAPEVAGRRPGDAPRLVADADYARETLGWVPRYVKIEEILETAWLWHRERRY